MRGRRDKPVSAWRFLLLLAAIRFGSLLEDLLRHFKGSRRRLPEWRPGISVVIPERCTIQALQRTLEAAVDAAERLDEEFEIIVVVNGAPIEEYRSLQERYSTVRWLHSKTPLGFSGAIHWGVREARFDWVYLLNSDMFLAADALSEIAPWRAAHVFAVASQIFFADSGRRREETGWTGFRVEAGVVQIFDVPPENETTVRGHLYAGGGSSLFRRELLLRFLSPSHPYNPVYWEDVEWGVRAWQAGYEVLFCPTSHATHLHRTTVSQVLSSSELDGILWRNQMLFSLRNGFRRRPRWTLVAGPPGGWDGSLLRTVTCIRQAASLLHAFLIRARAPARDVDLERVHLKFYPQACQRRDRRHTVLVVSPFAVYPPGHGGARRIANLLRYLARDFNIVLLSDEEALYEARHLAAIHGPIAIHLTGARPNDETGTPRRIARIHSHSHARLKAETERLAMVYEASLVQIEYVELAAVINKERVRIPWVITLHDVLFSGEGQSDAADRFEASLIAEYDAVIACSPEDLALLRRYPMTSTLNLAVVPNSAAPPTRYISSRGNRTLLFAGPFRYEPNLSGILGFLEMVFPALRREIPDVELIVLGGRGADSIARRHRVFQQPGVLVQEHVDDVSHWLERCALTVNPVSGVRGSSIKVLESVAHGRVCVSTVDGARGLHRLRTPALAIVQQTKDFLPALCELLADEQRRVGMEAPDERLLAAMGWEQAARLQAEVYRKLLE